MGQRNNNCQSTKTFFIIHRNNCFVYANYHKTRVAVVNNPIRSKIPCPNICWFPSAPDRARGNRMFTVRDSPVTISCGFKVEFCAEKWFHGVLAWSDYPVDKCITWIAAKMDMTPFQVSCWRGKFLPQTRSGTPSNIHRYTMEQLACRSLVPCSCAQWLRCYDIICNAFDTVLIRFVTTH